MENQTIYSKFEKEINGKIRKFWVQQLPEDQKQVAIQHFGNYFLRDEPMNKTLRTIEDQMSIEFNRKLWWYVTKQNNALACFTELENGQKEMVAVNFCYRASTNEDLPVNIKTLPEGKKTIFEAIEYINKMKDMSKELGTTEYLGALGLIVHPEYRGYSIGLHILEARRSLCEKIGLKASVTLFTSPASQRLAEKAGFKDLVSITYDDLEKMRPSSKFPNINEYSKRVRNMYILYK